MAYRGPAEVSVTIAGQNLSGNIVSIGGIKRMANMVESHGFSDDWVERVATGVRTLEPIEIEALYDDATDDTRDTLRSLPTSPNDATVALVIDYGNSETTTVNGWITEYEPILDRANIHMIRAMFTPTAGPTDA